MTKTTQLTATVTVDIYPAPGQSLASAREEIAAAIYHQLSSWDYDFLEDYGATVAEVEDGTAKDAMHGYEGPYATGVDIEFDTVKKDGYTL